MIYEILRAANLRVGVYTSPHLLDVRERIRSTPELATAANGAKPWQDWIHPDAFAHAIERIRHAVESDTWPDGPPTYFELLTAAAFLYFARQRVEIAVLEVGLGGRLDATNVVDPVVSVLGPIGLDHTDVLGRDVKSIAREKLGIIRPGRVLISAQQEPEVAALIEGVATAQNCWLIAYGHTLSSEIFTHTMDGMRLSISTPRGTYDALSLPLIGRHQAENASLALAAVESLAPEGMPHAPVHVGLARTEWPGRLEVIQTRPVVVFDGAHNPPSVSVLRKTLDDLWPKAVRRVVIGLSADKDASELAKVLGPMSESIVCTQSRHPRACDAQRLAEQLASCGRPISVISDPIDAYTYVLNTASRDDVIVVMGSFFLIGELKTALRYAQDNRERSRLKRAPVPAA
jgi:dihydrofolate synthase/folylpolyglutamate synthase